MTIIIYVGSLDIFISMYILFIFHGIMVHLKRTIYSDSNTFRMNCTRKFFSTIIPIYLSLVAIFVISMTCLCIIRESSNFMVVKLLVNVSARYLSIVWECSSTNFINSFTLPILERADLILLAMFIHINIKLHRLYNKFFL